LEYHAAQGVCLGPPSARPFVLGRHEPVERMMGAFVSAEKAGELAARERTTKFNTLLGVGGRAGRGDYRMRHDPLIT
jgi:hypothetical protein